jgi:hypothetical protein
MTRFLTWHGLTLVVAGVAIWPADASWQSAFELTCFRRRTQAPPTTANYGPPVVAYAAPSACDACAPPCPPPQPVCTTRYVQRSYYQPVTTYQCRSYYEPVTTMKTSYYYEPVTTCRYSYYYDPCTCSYRMVSQPQTTMQLKSQTCAVTNYVQRTMMVPVQSYRIATYYEPQTCCSLADPCNPCPTCSPTAPAAPTQPAVSEGAAPAAGVQEFRSGGNGSGGNTNSPLYNQPQQPAPAVGSGSSYRFAPPKATAPPPAPKNPIVPKFDRIALEEQLRSESGLDQNQASFAKRSRER